MSRSNGSGSWWCHRVAAVLLMGLVFIGSTAARGADGEIFEEIVVVGRKPGPPLWEVANGDHRLYVFGSLQPLPESLDWDSERVEWIISGSSEFIEAPALTVSTTNPFRIPGFLLDYRRQQRLPEGQTLEDVLPADLYALLLTEKQRFAPKNRRLFGLRPMFAAEVLSKEALDSVGLTADSPLPARLRKIARKHDLVLTPTSVDMPIEEGLKLLGQISRQADEACLATTLQSIRTDLTAAVARARAWVDGSMDLLRAQDWPDAREACTVALLDGPKARQARDDADALWLAAAERALKNNRSTLAVLPMREVLRADGLLNRLGERGFVISGAARTN